MLHYERDYMFARLIFSVLEIAGWVVISIGAVLGVFGFFTGGVLGQLNALGGGSGNLLIHVIGALPGLLISTVGLVFVSIVQAQRATVDTAEMTRDLLRIARADARPTSARTPAPAVAASTTAKLQVPPSTGERKLAEGEEVLVETYKGKEVLRRYNGHFVDGRWFPNLAAAKKDIDSVEGEH